MPRRARRLEWRVFAASIDSSRKRIVMSKVLLALCCSRALCAACAGAGSSAGRAAAASRCTAPSTKASRAQVEFLRLRIIGFKSTTTRIRPAFSHEYAYPAQPADARSAAGPFRNHLPLSRRAHLGQLRRQGARRRVDEVDRRNRLRVRGGVVRALLRDGQRRQYPLPPADPGRATSSNCARGSWSTGPHQHAHPRVGAGGRSEGRRTACRPPTAWS